MKSIIRFILSGDASPLEEAGKRGEKALKDVRQEAKESGAAIGKWGAAAAAAAVTGAAVLVAKTMAAIDAQAKFAASVRTTASSMAVLERAGDLAGISFDKIQAGAKKLDVVMGQAAAGAQAQADIFKRLNLDVEALAKQPLDQRIQSVNQAISQNIPLVERASIAAQVFGEEAGAAFARLDPATMSEAARQAEIFGTAISDVDAAKIEQANDAMSTISMAFKGLATQFTVQVAPILKVIGDLFLKTAADSGGMAVKVEGAFDKIVKAAAFVISAADGIKRVFTITADVIIAVISKMVAAISGKIAGLLETMNSIASAVGIDVLKGPAESVRRFSNEAQGVVKEAMANIDATLNKEMAGETFLKMVDKAKAAATASAEAALEARKAVLGGEGGSPAAKDTSAEDAKAKAEADALAKRLDSLKMSFATEQELIARKHEEELALIQEGLASQQLTRDQAYELEIQSLLAKETALSDIEQQQSEKRKAFAEAEAAAKKAILGNAMNALTSLMNSGSRKMFEVGKAASIAQAVVATWTGATEALKLGWPLGPLAAGAIVAGGMANIQNIRKQQFGGGGSVSAGSMPTANVNAAATGTGGGGVNQPTQRTNITLIGDVFGREAIVGLLNEALRDGYTINSGA